MTNQHPITPPDELVEQWRATPEYTDLSEKIFVVSLTTKKLQDITTHAAQWGADQELEACINFVYDNELCDPDFHNNLRDARRPKPSLKEQALKQLDEISNCFRVSHGGPIVCDKIRKALEAL